MSKSANIPVLRKVLLAGSVVFGASALFLMVAPGFFAELLGLSSNPELDWAFRMIAITLVALTGNMASVSLKGTDQTVLVSARVMQFSALGLGVLTLLLPVALTPFAIAYAVVGFGFSAAYTSFLLTKSREN